MEPDDVVIADFPGQALDIFLQGPWSAHKNGIVKTFNHTFIPIHTCTLLKQRAKPSTQQIRRLRLVVIFLSTVVANRHCSPLSFTRPLPVQCSGGRRPGTFAFASRDCSTSEAFSPRTVLTENICGYVQQILRHQPTTMPFLTTPAVILSCLASAAAQPDSW